MDTNDLQILIQALIDETKSILNIREQLQKMSEKLSIAIAAKLDKSKSKKQIKTDLSAIDKLNVGVTGKLDKTATRKKLKSDLSSVKTDPIKVQAEVDKKQIQKDIKSIGTVKIDAKVDGAGKLNDTAAGIESIQRKAGATIAGLTLLRQAFISLERAAKNMATTAAELDKQLTDLRMVTGESYEDASRLVDSYNVLAKELGSTTTQVLNASSEWLRQGKSIQETQELIRQSMILSKVGAMDADTATKRLTSTMMGYGLAVSEVAGVVDRLTAVDMAAAVSADNIAEALSHTASSASLAGLSLDKIIAYLTVVQETTQKSASVVGESFKSIFARMGKVTNGDAVDDLGENISGVESTLRSLGIELRKSEDEFRNFDEILDEVGNKWATYSTVVQRQIATAFGGVYQSENFLALMNNYEKVAKYMDVSANAAGTAEKKFNAYQESVEAHYNTMIASAEALSKKTVPTELLNGLMDAGTAVMDFATSTNLLSTALTGLGTAFAVKELGVFGGKVKDAYTNISNLTTAFTILDKAADVRLGVDEFNSLLAITKNLSTAQLKLVVSNKALTTQQRMAILTASGLSEAEAKQTLTAMGLATAEGATTAATFSLSGAFKALTAAIAANPIGFLLVTLTTLVSVVSTVKDKSKEARDAAIEAGDAAASLSDEIIDLTGQYIDLCEAVKTDTSAKEDLLKTQNDLIEKLGIEKNRVQELVQEYGNLTDAIKAASLEKLTQVERDLRGGLSAKKEALFDAAKANGIAKYSMNHIITSWNKQNADVNRKVLQALVDKGMISAGSYGSLGMELWLPTDGRFDPTTIEGIINSYERLGTMMDAVSDAAGSDNAVYKALYDAYNKCSGAIDDYRNSITSLNDNLAQQYMLQGLIGKEVPATKEDFDAYRQSVIDAAVSSGQFIGTNEEIAASVDGVLKSQSRFSSFYTDEMNDASGAAAQVEKAVTNLTERVKEMQTAYKVLETAQQEMASGAGLSAETIQALADANENYLDFLYEENGVIKLNTDAWRENANSKMESEMFDIEREIRELQEQNSELEKQNQTLSNNIDLYEEQRALGNDGGMWNQLIVDTTNSIQENNDAIDANNARIRENQGLLAVYGSLYGSITGDMTAYSQALKNFDNVATIIDSVAASFASLANLQNTVADGFTLSLEKILEYAKAYPQILDSATVTADGELALNEAVVNSFIEGKKAELNTQIDSQIAQLEADKAVLMAKKEFAQSQLELAQAVGTGEGKISKEVAEYRINAGNAMAEALIAMKMDEANAYRLTAAAMAGNEQEFARIAAECFENVDSNSVKAAYDMANAFFTNSQNATLSIASIAEQAHQTAAAVAGMANGVIAGSSNPVFYGSGGVYTGSYGFSGVNGNFQGVDLDYQAKTATLDDYISQLQLDISDYTDAIAQIDGQIATLQALKGTPLDKFQNLVSNAADIVGGKNNGSGSSSGGSNKADEAQKLVDEYVAAIDQYYEALKRLEEAQERRKSLEKKLEHTDDFSEKIYIAGDLVGAYEAEKEAENNLMAAKQATIAANVSALRNLGFDVDYDSSKNKLFIKNLEHLNELTASTIGEYETLQDATNALRKDTEDLIDATEQLNSDNIDATDTIEDLGYQVLETKNNIVSYIEEIYKEQTEAYRKIIDQRKELIQSAKDEYDYESDVADKVKEIADLQARIDQLSLDDSRSALAERRALEEELAKLQLDLSKTQEDHSTNAQLDALDKMADDYEQTVEEDIEKLKQTVNSTSDVWSAFYNTILGNNVSVGDSIDAEIVDAWLRAAQAVQTYGAAVNTISGVSTTVADLPKYHDGGIVSGSNLGNDELLAVLQEGEIVFTHAQLIGMIENARNGIQGALESIVQNLVGSTPAVSNVMNSIANDNSSTDNSSEVISQHIEINFSHSGFMSESDMKKYGDQFADIALGKLNEAFRRKGIINNHSARFRPG